MSLSICVRLNGPHEVYEVMYWFDISVVKREKESTEQLSSWWRLWSTVTSALASPLCKQ
jgi:hypothetical protein